MDTFDYVRYSSWSFENKKVHLTVLVHLQQKHYLTLHCIRDCFLKSFSIVFFFLFFFFKLFSSFIATLFSDVGALQEIDAFHTNKIVKLKCYELTLA